MGAIIGGVLGLVGAGMSASASKKAANAQERAAREATQLQKYMFDTSRTDMLPWLDAGKTALTQYMSELGLGGGTSGTGTAGPSNAFQATPGYQFRVEEGTKGVLNSLSALGMKNSGKALKSLERFSQGLASEEYGNWLNRVAGVAGQGQSQANTIGQMSANAGNSMAGTIQDAGAARASGYVGASNAWSQGLQQVGNSLGQYFGNKSVFPSAPSYSGGLY